MQDPIDSEHLSVGVTMTLLIATLTVGGFAVGCVVGALAFI